jgi:hypothetical protein
MRRSVLFAGVGAAVLFAACSDDPVRYKPVVDAGADTGTDAGLVGDDKDASFNNDATSDGSKCSPNKMNFEVPDNGCDDDADGEVDNDAACDDGLDFAADATDFARALGICQTAEGGKWGILNAEYSQGHAGTQQISDWQHGLLPQFGDIVRPREGSLLGVLSTGYAREWDDPSGVDCGSCQFKGHSQIQTWNPGTGIPGGAPPGYPKAAMGCENSTQVFDAVALKLTLQVPANAKGFQFDFNFYSGEWPEYVCTSKNDSFIVWYKSAAFNEGEPENISFDSAGNPVSVNNAFFDRCTPNLVCNGKNLGECPGGTEELQGTGFYRLGSYCGSGQSTSGGATGWLTTQAPVVPNETIELEFIIWDTGDGVWDSSVLLDHFQWVPSEVTGPGTTRPPT